MCDVVKIMCTLHHIKCFLYEVSALLESSSLVFVVPYHTRPCIFTRIANSCESSSIFACMRKRSSLNDSPPCAVTWTGAQRSTLAIWVAHGAALYLPWQRASPYLWNGVNQGLFANRPHLTPSRLAALGLCSFRPRGAKLLIDSK